MKNPTSSAYSRNICGFYSEVPIIPSQMPFLKDNYRSVSCNDTNTNMIDQSQFVHGEGMLVDDYYLFIYLFPFLIFFFLLYIVIWYPG